MKNKNKFESFIEICKNTLKISGEYSHHFALTRAFLSDYNLSSNRAEQERILDSITALHQNKADDEGITGLLSKLEDLKDAEREIIHGCGKDIGITSVSLREYDLLTIGRTDTLAPSSNNSFKNVWIEKLKSYERAGFVKRSDEEEGVYDLIDHYGLRNMIANSVENAKETALLCSVFRDKDQVDLLIDAGFSAAKARDVVGPLSSYDIKTERAYLLETLSHLAAAKDNNGYVKTSKELDDNAVDLVLVKITSQECDLLNSDGIVEFESPSSKLTFHIENQSLERLKCGGFLVKDKLAFAKSVSSADSINRTTLTALSSLI